MQSRASLFLFTVRMEAVCFPVQSVSARLKKMLFVWYTASLVQEPEFSALAAGDEIEVLGSLGNGFPLEEAEGKKVFLMGGGIGIPPMLETAKQLKADKRIIAGYRDELFLTEELEANVVYISPRKMAVRVQREMS